MHYQIVLSILMPLFDISLYTLSLCTLYEIHFPYFKIQIEVGTFFKIYEYISITSLLSSDPLLMSDLYLSIYLTWDSSFIDRIRILAPSTTFLSRMVSGSTNFLTNSIHDWFLNKCLQLWEKQFILPILSQ
jgi:hypothetical protein